MSLVFTLFLLLSGAEMQVADYLRAGEVEINNGHWVEAADLFNKAIGTGMLNDAGLAMVYWSIYVCYDQLHNNKDAPEALLGFIAHINSVDRSSEFIKEWVKRYNVKDRLDYALVALDAYWANRNKYSCRSELFACYLPNIKLLQIYRDKLFCSDRVQVTMQNNFVIVHVDCNRIETFYFMQ